MTTKKSNSKSSSLFGSIRENSFAQTERQQPILPTLDAYQLNSLFNETKERGSFLPAKYHFESDIDDMPHLDKAQVAGIPQPFNPFY